MQVLRLARKSVALHSPSLLAAQRKCLATATVNQVHQSSAASSSIGASSRGTIAPIPLSNIEAQWERMSSEEKLSVHEQLEGLQVKDWKELSLDEKKAGKSSTCAGTTLMCLDQVLTAFFSAAYYVAFGPHGPRTPTSQPGDNVKVFFSTLALIAVGGVLFLSVKAFSEFPPDSLQRFIFILVVVQRLHLLKLCLRNGKRHRTNVQRK